MSRKRKRQRYCGPCDEWVAAKHLECPRCGADTDLAEPEPELTYADAVDSGTAGGDAVTLERDR